MADVEITGQIITNQTSTGITTPAVQISSTYTTGAQITGQLVAGAKGERGADGAPSTVPGPQGPQGPAGPAGGVMSVNSKTGTVTLNQDEISDGTTYKQYSQTEKTKLAGIATGATQNASDASLRDRATHTGTQAISTVTGLQTALDGKQASGDYATNTALTSGLAGKANSSHTHAQSDITGLSTSLTAKEDAANKSTSTSLGTSDTLYPSQGAVKSYVDTGLTAKANTSSLATVATSGAYADLTGKPTIPAQFNPIGGTNVTLSGTYPNITFNAAGGGGGGGDMFLASAQTNTGAKTFASGSLLMRDPTNTFSSEPYSDSNPPFTLNLSDQSTSPTTPPSGQSTLYTTDGTNLNLKDNTGTTVTLADTSSSQALTNKNLTGAGNTFPTFNQSTTGSAATLTTSRNIQVNLGSTAAVAFNGSANVSPGVTGTLPVANGGSGRATATTAYGLIAAGTTATGAQQTVSPGTSGQVLRSNGASALPSFQDDRTQGLALKTASATLTTAEVMHQAIDATSGAVTLTLPSTTTPGIAFDVLKVDSGSNTVTLSSTSINGSATVVLPKQWDSARVVSTATSGSWYLFNTSVYRFRA